MAATQQIMIFVTKSFLNLFIVENPFSLFFRLLFISYLLLQTKEEEEMRFGIWKENWAHINKHNSANSHDYTLGMNHFGDMSDEEFTQKMLLPPGMLATKALKEKKNPWLHPKLRNIYMKVSSFFQIK